MTKRESDLLKKIEALEARIRALEARPPMEYHYHYTQPYYLPTYNPWWTQPTAPYPHYPTWSPTTCGVGGMVSGSAVSALAFNDASVPHTLT